MIHYSWDIYIFILEVLFDMYTWIGIAMSGKRPKLSGNWFGLSRTTQEPSRHRSGMNWKLLGHCLPLRFTSPLTEASIQERSPCFKIYTFKFTARHTDKKSSVYFLLDRPKKSVVWPQWLEFQRNTLPVVKHDGGSSTKTMTLNTP